MVIILVLVARKAVWVMAQEPEEQNSDAHGPVVGEPVVPGISPAVKTLPTAEPRQSGDPVRIINPRQRPVTEDSRTVESSEVKEKDRFACPEVEGADAVSN